MGRGTWPARALTRPNRRPDWTRSVGRRGGHQFSAARSSAVRKTGAPTAPGAAAAASVPWARGSLRAPASHIDRVASRRPRWPEERRRPLGGLVDEAACPHWAVAPRSARAPPTVCPAGAFAPSWWTRPAGRWLRRAGRPLGRAGGCPPDGRRGGGCRAGRNRLRVRAGRRGGIGSPAELRGPGVLAGRGRRPVHRWRGCGRWCGGSWPTARRLRAPLLRTPSPSADGRSHKTLRSDANDLGRRRTLADAEHCG